MADFKIALPNGQIIEVDGKVTVKEGGILQIEDENRSPYLLSPSGWWSIDPAPGRRPVRPIVM